MTRRIALCVDDFGLHAGVDDAALELAAQGRLNALGCLVGAPTWRSACARLGALDRERVEVGLHLDLTEHPLGGARVRRPLAEWVRRAWTGGLGGALGEALRNEVAAQLDAFGRDVGRPPDFIDGHQHVHELPGVREPLLDALARRRTLHRPWLRSTRPPAGVLSLARVAPAAAAKPLLIAALGDIGLRRALRAHGLSHNAHLLGVYGFDADEARYRRLLHGWLALARDGDLLMCHAARGAAADDSIGAARAVERRVLADAAFGELLASHGVTLAPIGRIVAPAR